MPRFIDRMRQEPGLYTARLLAAFSLGMAVIGGCSSYAAFEGSERNMEAVRQIDHGDMASVYADLQRWYGKEAATKFTPENIAYARQSRLDNAKRLHGKASERVAGSVVSGIGAAVIVFAWGRRRKSVEYTLSVEAAQEYLDDPLNNTGMPSMHGRAEFVEANGDRVIHNPESPAVRWAEAILAGEPPKTA